mmetsp:Transcript_52274/g.118032  ORF Transcript_52274/g.118032 Transcript_52274/m.118032 type:complete len:238 (-) Transcript_52274:115-828(-)
MRAVAWLLALLFRLALAASLAVDCKQCWEGGFAARPECCQQCPGQCPSSKCIHVHSTGYECYDPQRQVVCDMGTGEMVCPMSEVCPSYGSRCSGGPHKGWGCNKCPQGQEPDAENCRCLSCTGIGKQCNASLPSGGCCKDPTGTQMPCVDMGRGPECISPLPRSQGQAPGAPKPDPCPYFGKLCKDSPKGTCGWDDPDTFTREACEHGNAVCGEDPNDPSRRICVLGPPLGRPALFM